MIDFFINIFNVILYQPLLNALILLYAYIPGNDFGIAVIVLTLLINFILYPLGVQGIKSQKAMQELQPKIKELQAKHKDDKEKQARAVMELYKKEKINPLSGCLPLLIQLPILIALYHLFWHGLNADNMVHLYSFAPVFSEINTTFLGLVDLGKPSSILAILAGITQFFQTKMIIPKTKKPKKNDGQMAQFSDMMQKQMLYFLPIFIVFILWNLPSALALYLIVVSLFTIVQQHFVTTNASAQQS